jgi:hypothetical protein
MAGDEGSVRIVEICQLFLYTEYIIGGKPFWVKKERIYGSASA